MDKSSIGRSAARGHTKDARRLATCNGPPDYTFNAAYDEAVTLDKWKDVGYLRTWPVRKPLPTCSRT
jgi:hypothetical protein